MEAAQPVDSPNFRTVDGLFDVQNELAQRIYAQTAPSPQEKRTAKA